MNPWTTISELVFSHLPDSLSERRSLLCSLEELLPSDHAARSAVVQHLDLLNRIDLDQREFPFGSEVVIQAATTGRPGEPIPPPPPGFASHRRRTKGGAR